AVDRAGLPLRRFRIGLGLVAVLAVPLVAQASAGFGEDADDVQLLFHGGRTARPAASGIHDRDVERRRSVLVPARIIGAVGEQRADGGGAARPRGAVQRRRAVLVRGVRI